MADAKFTSFPEATTPAATDILLIVVNPATTPITKKVQVGNLAGAHVHDAGAVTYTPGTLTDWDSDADPGDVDQALDQLAERVDDLEVTTHGAVTLAADADVLLGLSTQQITLDNQNANVVLAGPASGAAADPTFRALVWADIPVKPYRGITALRTLDATDYTVNCTANSFTVTLPTAVGCAGRVYVIKNSGTGVITIDTTSSQTIDGSLTQTLSIQYECITVQSDGANWIVIQG